MPTFILKKGVGKCYLRRNGRLVLIHQGESIQCEEAEIGLAARHFQKLSELPQKTKPEPVSVSTPGAKPASEFVIRERGGALDGYDVVHGETGEPLNDAPMTLKDARDLAGEPSPGHED